MAGTRSGAMRMVKTIKERHGEDFYRKIGREGGSKKVKKGFACNRALASVAGRRGGKISKRGKKYESNLEQN